MKFERDKFSYHGGYLTYHREPSPARSEFVARFKYANPSASASTFRTFLIKNFTVEEYFDRLAAGESPLPILESKGYILPHIRKRLRETGLPVTREGYKVYLDKVTAEIRARAAHTERHGWNRS